MLNESTITSKPKITKNKLALRNRNISSLDEVFQWYSDNELDKLERLDIRDNQITNIDAALNLKSLIVLKASNNRISSISPIKRTKKTYWENIDLRNNFLSSYDAFHSQSIHWLLLENNNITHISKLGFGIRYLNLAKNRISSLEGLNESLSNFSLSSRYREINLCDNPITDITSVKALAIKLLPLEEYDKKDDCNSFKEIRSSLERQWAGAINSIESLFKTINERKAFVYLNEKFIDDNSLGKHLGTDLPECLRSDEFDELAFIEVNVEGRYDWVEFCSYFGVKGSKDGVFKNFKAGTVIPLILLAMAIIFLLSLI